MDVRDELVQTYRWLRQYGLNDSHSGNASVRAGEDIWITPTGACADTLEVDDLIHGKLDQLPPAGASLDGALHWLSYRRNPAATAVLHSHGPHSLAVTWAGEDFLPLDFEGQYYFPRVPVLNIPFDRYLEDAPEAVANTLAAHRITVVRGHGVYSAAETLNLAYKWTCSLESSARLRLLVSAQAQTSPS